MLTDREITAMAAREASLQAAVRWAIGAGVSDDDETVAVATIFYIYLASSTASAEFALDRAMEAGRIGELPQKVIARARTFEAMLRGSPQANDGDHVPGVVVPFASVAGETNRISQ